MKSLTVKLPAELRVEMEAEAQLTGKSVSAIVRERLLRNSDKQVKGKLSIYERTKDLCGIGRSGIPDLATNPNHMKGFGQ
jgi:hypothetical protein